MHIQQNRPGITASQVARSLVRTQAVNEQETAASQYHSFSIISQAAKFRIAFCNVRAVQ